MALQNPRKYTVEAAAKTKQTRITTDLREGVSLPVFACERADHALVLVL